VRRWALVCLLAVGVIIAYIDRTNFSIALAARDFRTYFDLSDTQRGLLSSVFFWSYTALQIPAGLIVDRFGVRIPLTAGLLLWCGVAAATSMATTMAELVALRLALGVGESVIYPGGLSWIRANIREHERGLAVGIFVSGTKWGPAIAGPLSTFLISGYGWRNMFLILGAGGAVWLLPWLLFSGEKKPDHPGARASTGAGMPSMDLLRTPQMWGTLIGTFCYNYFLFYSLTWLPAYFVESRQLSLNSMGIYTFFSFAGSAVVAIAAGWAADSFISKGFNAVHVRRWFTVAGMLLASTEVIGAMSSSNRLAIFFAIFSMTGLGLATANYWALTQTLMPREGGGRVAGFQNTSLNLAGIVAPIVTGWLKEVTGSYTVPMQAIWVVLVIGIGAYMFLIREPVAYAPPQPSDAGAALSPSLERRAE
jgi:ACS family D-galactonate transporter-like MFS transporter